MRRTLLSRLAGWGVAFGAALMVAFGPLGAEAQKAQWVVGVQEEADVLDPPRGYTALSEMYLNHFLEPLVGIEGEDLKAVGLLAERWTTINPTTWRFFLRKGVKFHNGEAFDAEDVKYSFEVYADPKSRRAHMLSAVERVEVRDSHTVDVITAKPFGALLTNMARLFVLPKDTREKLGADGFGQQPIGTGPYRFVQWQRDHQLVLEANSGYWRAAPSPNRLVFRVIKDPATRAAELRAGGVDIITNPPIGQLEVLDRGETQVVAAKAGRVIMYPFNLKQPPFDNLKVRQAVNLAVDREVIVRSVLGGRGMVLGGPFTLGWLGYDPEVKPYPYDPARARLLLAEAGYPQGFETSWSISSGALLKDAEIAEAAAAQLRQVGVRVALAPTQRAVQAQQFEAGNYQGMTSSAWGSQFEPDLMLSWLVRPHSMLPRIQEQIEAGRREVDPEKRRKIYQALYRVFQEEAPWLFIHAQDELWAKRRDVVWTPYYMSGSKVIVYYFSR
jgi:peptide/nickel transport system substrate-binding protein